MLQSSESKHLNLKPANRCQMTASMKVHCSGALMKKNSQVIKARLGVLLPGQCEQRLYDGAGFLVRGIVGHFCQCGAWDDHGDSEPIKEDSEWTRFWWNSIIIPRGYLTKP